MMYRESSYFDLPHFCVNYQILEDCVDFFEQLGPLCAPLSERSKGRFVLQVFSWDVVIIQIDEAFAGCLEGGG